MAPGVFASSRCVNSLSVVATPGGHGPADNDEVRVQGCNFEVSSDDWESHQLAHQLARDEGTTGGGGARACANDEVVDLTDSPTFERCVSFFANDDEPSRT